MSHGLTIKPRCFITDIQQWNREATGSLPTELLSELSSFCPVNIRHRIFLTSKYVSQSLRKATFAFRDDEYRKYGVRNITSQLDAIGSVKHLNLSVDSVETLSSVVRIIERSPFLETLKVSFYTLEQLPVSIPALVTTRPRLRHLSVRFSQHGPEVEKFIFSIAPPTLQSLALTAPKLDPGFLRTAARNFQHLESMTLRISSYVSKSLVQLAQLIEPLFTISSLKYLAIRHLYGLEFVPALLDQKRSLTQHPFVAYFADKPVLSRLHPLFVFWIQKNDAIVDLMSFCIERNAISSIGEILSHQPILTDPNALMEWGWKLLEHSPVCLSWIELFRSHGHDFLSMPFFGDAFRFMLHWQVLLGRMEVADLKGFVVYDSLPTDEQPTICPSLVALLNIAPSAWAQRLIACCLMDCLSANVPFPSDAEHALVVMLNVCNNHGCDLLENRCFAEKQDTFVGHLVGLGRKSLLQAYLTCPIILQTSQASHGRAIHYSLNRMSASQNESVLDCLSFCRSLGL